MLVVIDRPFKSTLNIIKNTQPFGWVFFMAEKEGFVCIFTFVKIVVRLGPALAGNAHPRCI